MEMVDRCISCGKGFVGKGFVTFICPMCDTVIGRCGSCREQSVKYTCPTCGFTGP
ncbi:MAG: RNA-binding protein [Thermoplasmata archaeon]|nr:MAG: RNA-binding protein [Thermoplasmata archaeon]